MNKKLFKNVGLNTFKVKSNLNEEVLKTTLYRYDSEGVESELDIEVEYTYSSSSNGERESGTGLALSPDEPEDVEILGVTNLKTGEQIVLTKEEETEIISKIFSDVDKAKKDVPYDFPERDEF